MSIDTLPADQLPHTVGPTNSAQLLLELLQLADRSQRETAEFQVTPAEGIVCPWTLKRLLAALALRDEATVLHARRVALLSVGIATHLGWDDDAVSKLEVAALLHDVGKLGIPDHILHKPGRLNPDEVEYVLLHHHIAVDLLQACRIDSEIVEMVWASHTHGREATEEASPERGCVSQGARVLAIADAYDSLRNDQVYRKGKSHNEVMRLLNDQSGKPYDRNIVSTFDRWICHEGQSFLAHEAAHRLASTIMPSINALTTRHVSELSHVFSFLYTLESLYDGFCLLDEHSRFVVWNHGMQSLTGMSSQQMIGEAYGRRLLNLSSTKGTPLSDRDCPVNKVISRGVPNFQTLKIENRRAAQWTEVEVQALPLLRQNGTPAGAALIFRDCSPSKQNPGRYRELQQAARRDPLTGVGNRGEMESRLSRMYDGLKGSPVESSPFSLIFLDLDHFKSVNDTYGHATGDRVLVKLTRLIEDELYSGETICRFGGEEFVILCPETRLADAETRAERLRSAVSANELAKPDPVVITASFGVAQIEAGDTIETLIERADQALYDAKKGGRNRVCSRSTTRPTPEQKTAKKSTGELIHIHEFQARVAADMVMFKLSGFVDEAKVSIQSVKPNRIVLHAGSKGLLGGWGKTPERQPVKLVVEIGDPHHDGRWNAEFVKITATITPRCHCRKRDSFETRAQRLVTELRSYFAIG
ncbi:MAG: diguanylate cyclase [Planctomycetaceae bacterium]